MESVRDKVVLITGASSGIGAITAMMFAKYRSRLALTGRSAANLEKTAQECCQWGLPREKILTITADLKQEGDIRKIVDETIGYFKRLDVLINNAGISLVKTLAETNMEELDELLQVNVKAPFYLTKLSIPHLKASKGCVVNVSSVTTMRPRFSIGAYSMTKAALDTFATALSMELASSGVRVNSVNPSDTKTPMLVADMANSKDDLATRGRIFPGGRMGLPEEVANTIVYLASDAASFINGVRLPVDGGIHQTTSWFLSEQEEYAAS